MKAFLFIVLSVFLSGCVGVVTVSNPVTEFDAQNVRLAARGWCCSGQKVVSTKSQVIALWGQPDEQLQKNGGQVWRYKQSRVSWAGIVPLLIVPIPLMVPIGHNYTEIAFQNESVISAAATDGKLAGAICGIFLTDVDPALHFGCGKL